MSSEASAEERLRRDDCVVLTLDLEDCPMAEIPLSDLLDPTSHALIPEYHNVIRDTVHHALEECTWLANDNATRTSLTDAGFGMCHVRERGAVIFLRKAALQRLIDQRLEDRATPTSMVHVPVLIRFLVSPNMLPTPPPASTHTSSRSRQTGSQSRSSRHSRVPSEIDTVVPPEIQAGAEGSNVDTTTATPATTIPIPTAPVLNTTVPAGNMFRGRPVDIGNTTAYGMPQGRYQTPQEPFNGAPQPTARPLFDSATTNRTNALTRTPTRNHPFSAEVTFGAESFEEYMSQFMYAEVKFKDFRKATIPRFDSTKQDSFVHWYKLFCSTCLQWGVWCPPYESAQEDNIHGAWWNLLPASVRAADRFMSGLIYSALLLDNTFPTGSKEQSAIEGCPPNAGYHALYALLRLHHPLLHSVYSTANEIPKQRRSETFSFYTRRLQDFMARERLATRTYTESEALDLAVRNLLPDWRAEFRRLVERDKRSGPGGMMPFKLCMPQLATTFVEYAAELGRDPPATTSGSGGTSFRSATHHSVRRIETSPSASTISMGSDTSLADEEIDLIVKAIAQNQGASPLCLGCHQPGHTLEQCNRFVDYIVAESLAQRHPQLKAQVALSHRQFRSRLANASGRGRTNTSRVVRSLQADDNANPTTPGATEEYRSSAPPLDPSLSPIDEPESMSYQQHSLHAVDDDSEADFEACFSSVSINAVSVTVADEPSLPLFDSVVESSPPSSESLLLRRLAATHDPMSTLSYAHADNGSMACTTDEIQLLFSYRPLTRANVRLLDAGQHSHRPSGVGFLCVPVANRDTTQGVTSVFIRTYYTPTIPGIIISHAAISKQLGTTGYHMSSFTDKHGFIHFPHRLRRSQDLYITLQPTALRGGLSFTDALIVPSEAERSAPLPSSATINRLCTDHSTRPIRDTLDPTDGTTCQACFNAPSTPDFC